MSTNDRPRAESSRTRERRVVIGGVLVVALSLIFTFGVGPIFSRWRARELQISRADLQLAQLTGLLRQEAAFDVAANSAEAVLSNAGQRVIHARSSALGASALQTLLQGAADASALLVNRVDVASDLTTDGALTATLSAYGDIHGLAALLVQLARAPRVTIVERISVLINPSLRGAPDVLQITVAVRAPMVTE